MFLTKYFLVHISSMLTFFYIFLCIFLFLYKISIINLSDKIRVFIWILLIFPPLRKTSLKFMQTYCIQCIYTPITSHITSISACFNPQNLSYKFLFWSLKLKKITLTSVFLSFVSGYYTLFSHQETLKNDEQTKKESQLSPTLLFLLFIE